MSYVARFIRGFCAAILTANVAHVHGWKWGVLVIVLWASQMVIDLDIPHQGRVDVDVD